MRSSFERDSRSSFSAFTRLSSATQGGLLPLHTHHLALTMPSRKRSKTKSKSNRVDNDSDLESLEENSVLEENSIVASSDFCCGIDMSLVQVVLGEEVVNEFAELFNGVLSVCHSERYFLV